MTRRGFKGRRRRLALAPLLGAAILTVGVATVASAVGELSQGPGASACIATEGAGGCAAARSLQRVEDLVVSPDGRNVYAIGGLNGPGIAILDRDPATGALSQRGGAAACISVDGSEGCPMGRALTGSAAVAISPDGRSVYVASKGAQAVGIFHRDPATGALSQDVGKAGCISISGQDGRGGECQPGRALMGADGIAVSPDGSSVYVGGLESVAIFHRDPATGGLSQDDGATGCIAKGAAEGCESGRALLEVRDVAVSPDGRNVYAVGETAVAIFGRDAGGALTQAQEAAGCVSVSGMDGGGGACEADAGLGAPHDLAVSPNGSVVYATGFSSDSVAILDRGPDTGALSPKGGTAGCISKSGIESVCRQGIGLDGVNGIVTSPDGHDAYVVSFFSTAIASFEVDPAGGLAQKAGTAGCISADGNNGLCLQGRGLEGAFQLTVSPDGRNVYVASSGANTIAIFNRATPPMPDTNAPTVSGFKLSPPRFKAAPKGRSQFRFTLSEPATARIGIERARPGRRVGKRCKAPAPKLAKRRPCTRFTRTGALDYANRTAGANAIAFDGKVGRRKLPPGRYRATILATDAAGNRSAARRAGFTVLPARK